VTHSGGEKQKVPEGQEHSPIIPLPSIEPGGSVVVPIWLRGSHIGMHTVAMLFYYESDQGAVHPIEYRLCRYSREVQVVPSLKVQCKVVPCLSELNTHLLILEIENLMNSELLDLNLFSAVSKQWKLQLWSRLSEAEGAAASLGKLRPKQRSSLAFRVLSDEDRPLEEPKGKESVIHTDICLHTTPQAHAHYGQYGSSEPPIWPLLQSSSSPLSHHDMHVVLGWTIRPSEAEEDQSCWRSGQHHVSNLVHDLPVELGQGFQSSPVKVSVEYASSVAHDFSKCCMCNVPVCISIRSCCETQHLDITWEAFRPDEQDTLTADGADVKYSSPYVWVGVTRKHFAEPVLPGQQVKLETTLGVWQAGLYNINRFRVRVKTPNGILPLVYVPPMQHVLTVVDAINQPVEEVTF